MEQLCTADAGAVPTLLENLAPYRKEVQPRLHELWSDTQQPPQRRMRAGLGLLISAPEVVTEELFTWMLQTEDPRELELTRDVLAAHGAALTARLWEVVQDKGTRPEVRFRALVVLARFDPQDGRWHEAGPATLEPWLRADPLFFGVLTRALRPAGSHLVGPLVAVAAGRNEALADKRYEAASVLAVYAADQAEPLVEVVLESDVRQFVLLLPRLQALGGEAVALLRRELERPAAATLAERDSQATRQTNAGLALLRLGQGESVWPLLKHSPGSDGADALDAATGVAWRGRRGYGGASGAHAGGVGAANAAVGGAGEYDGERLPVELRERLRLPRLLE